jgi:DNA-directed RNA polymerase
MQAQLITLMIFHHHPRNVHHRKVALPVLQHFIKPVLNGVQKMLMCCIALVKLRQMKHCSRVQACLQGSMPEKKQHYL